jgi:hypothetical protein
MQAPGRNEEIVGSIVEGDVSAAVGRPVDVGGAPFTMLMSRAALGPPSVRETPAGQVVFVQAIIPPPNYSGKPCESLEEALEVAETERKALAAEGWTPRDFDVVGDPD